MSKEIKLITKELLKSWEPCPDGYKRYCKLFPEDVGLEEAIQGLIKDGHGEWGRWLFDECKKNNLFEEVISKGYGNTGDYNTGDCNTGDCNTGDYNTGDRNTGDCNTGDRNTGDYNTGDYNTGDCNTRGCNTGDYNTGVWNTGDYNTGDYNTGIWNTGDRNTGIGNTGTGNTGNRNAGDGNTGGWNTGDLNTGCFNTITPDELLVFNKVCKKQIWDNAYKPDFLFFDLIYWVDGSVMTDKEKAADPNFYIRGGQLRERDYKEAFKLSWEKADPIDRMRIKELPNFDAQIFFEISGIDLRE